jgi:hypothetical protein
LPRGCATHIAFFVIIILLLHILDIEAIVLFVSCCRVGHSVVWKGWKGRGCRSHDALVVVSARGMFGGAESRLTRLRVLYKIPGGVDERCVAGVLDTLQSWKASWTLRRPLLLCGLMGCTFAYRTAFLINRHLLTKRKKEKSNL